MLKPALLAALILLPAGEAVAQQFSAEMVPVGPGAEQAKLPPQKIYVANGKMRTEMTGPGGPRVVIADGKTGIAYMIMPQQKTYMVLPRRNEAAAWSQIDPENACPQWEALAKKSGQREAEGWDCARIREEPVANRLAVKYEATSPEGERFFAWIDIELRFMVKTLDGDGDGMELRDIREGPQPQTLFELPQGYKKLEMPIPQPLTPPPPPPPGARKP